MALTAELMKPFGDIKVYPTCGNVRLFNYTERCPYVMKTEQCSSGSLFVDYFELYYCILEPANIFQDILAMGVLLSICVVIFFFLNVTADRFFCPALKMISTTFHMSEHLAGVTLVAFGNGSPDLFSTLSSIDDKKRPIFSDLMGSAVYVSNIVAGLICVFAPFQMQASNVIRDLSFYLLAVIYIEYAIISGGNVTVAESIIILMIYVVYIVIIIFDQFFLKYTIKDLEGYLQRRQFLPEFIKAKKREEIAGLREQAGMQLLSRVSQTIVINTEENRQSSYIILGGTNNLLFQQFFNSLNPVDDHEWQDGSTFHKLVMLIKVPVRLFMTIFIPVCDYEMDAHGWSKLLNCLQLVYMPVLCIIFLFRDNLHTAFMVAMLTLLILIPLAIVVFMRTRTSVPPTYHIAFALLSTFGAMFTIYTCASEVVLILRVLGLILHTSSAFLGCTVLAWGNGIGDLVSNMTFAMQGYQKMAFAACFAAPFFNTVMSLGTVLLYRSGTSYSGVTRAKTGYLGENSFVFLVIMLFGLLLWAALFNFKARRLMGLFHIVAYLVFVLFAWLGEKEVVQTYAPMG